jgi:hypothetical protein
MAAAEGDHRSVPECQRAADASGTTGGRGCSLLTLTQHLADGEHAGSLVRDTCRPIGAPGPLHRLRHRDASPTLRIHSHAMPPTPPTLSTTLPLIPAVDTCRDRVARS